MNKNPFKPFMLVNIPQAEPDNTAVTHSVCNLADQVLAELDSVIGDTQVFLQDCYQKFDRLLSEAATSKAEVPAGDQADDKESAANSQQELEQVQAQEEIRQQVTLLVDAWLRLEQEQRLLLQTKQGLTAELSNRAEQTTDSRCENILQRLPGHQPRPIPAGPSAVDVGEPSAVYDFERLRREIELSRPSIKSN